MLAPTPMLKAWGRVFLTLSNHSSFLPFSLSLRVLHHPLLLSPLEKLHLVGNHYLTGDLSLSGGDLALGTGSATTTFTVSSTAFAITANATTTLGTTGLNIGSGQFAVQQTSGNVGIGDQTPASLFVVGSGDLFRIDSAGRTLLPFGASGAGNLSLSFTGDTDTGLYRANADEIRIQTAGADRITLTGAGNLGIATTSPSSLFAVHGAQYVSGTGFFGNTLTATSSVYLATAGGSVGIGRSSECRRGLWRSHSSLQWHDCPR